MPAVETYSSTGNIYIDAVLGSMKWVPSNLTYSFPTTAASYGSSYGDGESAKGFGAFNGTQQATARAALNLYSAVSNLTFTELGGASGPSADLRFAQSDLPNTAWAYFPSTNATGGDVWVNNSSLSYASPLKGNYAYFTIVHEIGHALGLEHSHENGMPLDRDSMEYTVMSYRSYAGASTSTGYTNETWGYAQSLMMYDIAAVQYMYGANYSTNSGNTTYTWSPTTGEMFVNGVGQGAPGDNKILLTVWDGGGNDTYSFANYATSLTIDLQPGAWTITSQEQRAKLNWDGSKLAVGNIANALLYQGNTLSLVENASGGSAADVIKGNETGNTLRGNGGNDKLYGLSGNDALFGGNGNDRLDGGAGNDKLYGQAGKDVLIGGSGADTFVFQNLNDSRGSSFDTIQDFRRGSDKIDLRGIDANIKAAGNQAFTFIGKSAFHGKAGELRFADGILSGDVNGDTIVDFKLKIAGLSALSKSDFYL